MMVLEFLSLRLRGELAIWLLVLMDVGFYVLFRYVQRRRWWVRYIPLLVLMLAEYILFQLIIEVSYVVLDYTAPGWFYLHFHSIPLLWIVIAELAMTGFTAFLLSGVWKWQEHHITALSVKEGVDSLPTGLLYFWNDGRIKLVNRRMMEIARLLMGLTLQDGNRFLARLKEGQETDKDPILGFPDGSVWSFHHREAALENEPLHELIATDVTEESRLREELAEENRRLAAMNHRLQNLNEMIGEITVEKETLATKIRIHDETGRTMLTTRRFVEGDEEGVSREELFAMWERVVALPSAPLHPESGEDPAEELYQAADAIGIRLRLIGEAESRQVQKLLFAGARECLTNAYRHAEATELTIRIEQREADGGKETLISYTNDGTVPDGPVSEGGGLSSLRRIVESEGAGMEISCSPEFCLQIRIPCQ